MNHQAPPELTRARQLWAQEQFKQSIEWFDRAVSLYPENFYVLVDAARVHGQYFNHPRMEKLIAQMIEVLPNDFQLHLQIGMTYRMAYRPLPAIKHLKKSVNLQPNNGELKVGNWIIWLEINRFFKMFNGW